MGRLLAPPSIGLLLPHPLIGCSPRSNSDNRLFLQRE
jgi:hypothetical protein